MNYIIERILLNPQTDLRFSGVLADLDDIRVLLRQLSPGKEKHLLSKFYEKHPAHLLIFGARMGNRKKIDDANETQDDGNGRIVSMATLSLVCSCHKQFGQVHEVITDAFHRGKQHERTTSLAHDVLRLLIDTACDMKLSYLELSSKPSRGKANSLYQDIGFELISQAVGDKGTNVYRLYLSQE